MILSVLQVVGLRLLESGFFLTSHTYSVQLGAGLPEGLIKLCWSQLLLTAGLQMTDSWQYLVKKNEENKSAQRDQTFL